MSRSPNAEQLLAIEHRGGVLLRAGAGSGKTFVLVHHIVYLTEQWITEFKDQNVIGFEEFIRQKFSQVVMMTFTKKAAGEMSIRLTEKFETKALEESPDQDLWKIANECLPLLMVTTIDGFCRKLITLGYFPHLSTEAKIIFGTERIDQVREIVEEWFIERSLHFSQDILDILIREKNAVLNAFTNVFGDPGLRLAWKKFSPSDISPEKLNDLLERSFRLNDLETALGAIIKLDLPSDKRTSFESVVADFQASGLPEVTSVETFNLYAGLFEKVSRIDNRKKEAGHIAAKDGLVKLREWVQKWQEVLKDYQEHFETKVLPWMNLCLELFNYIEDRIDPNQGMTFGDIEYLVSLGLENAADRERIQKNYTYLIVDEFQDTSDIQFRIIRDLIGDEFGRLFCVGDAKQAIYGFRGGELSVFRECGELIPVPRSLANNYRSLPEIIKFNNSLFRTLLPLGYNFQGNDPFSVEPEDQNVPTEVTPSETGAVHILTANLDRDVAVEKSFSNEEINRLEATLIAEAIEEEQKTTSNVSTILYSKIKPSTELIRILMAKKIGFTAQFKIDLVDDPLLGLFICLLRSQFDQNVHTKNKYPLFMIKSYFQILGVDEEVTIASLDEFAHDIHYWGLVEAFRKFVFKLHFTNENSDLNFENIETIAQLYHQDPELIMEQLLRNGNDRISLELRSGENSHRVHIMTAHSSKGLEFDSVYLGGIYTNGKENPPRSLFGDFPGSFKWYLDLSQKMKQDSPFLVYENELAGYKDFSEAKRLFYVACTRAKKKLTWVDFEIPEKGFPIPKNSWILGLRAWVEKGMEQENVKEIKYQDFDWRERLSAQSLPELPLFFYDPVGIFPKGSGDSELVIAAELSVTRLNALMDCPRKFYLQNILKVPAETTEKTRTYVEEIDEEIASVLRSSSERGTYIHERIAEGLVRNFVVPRSVFGTELQGPVEWALELLRPLEAEFNLVPEKAIKFELFNFMISGIPDLVLIPKGDKKAQIWDFKTGRITQDNLSHYWLQLSVYAYALYHLGEISKEEEISLVLCFVDQRKTLEEKVTYPQVVQKLYPLWRSQNEPWKTNPDHCSQCSYGSICPR